MIGCYDNVGFRLNEYNALSVHVIEIFIKYQTINLIIESYFKWIYVEALWCKEVHWKDIAYPSY